MTFAMGSSSRALRLLYRVPRGRVRPAPPGAELLPWGSVPLRDISQKSPPPASIPGPLRSALDVSHVLDGLLLFRPCGFISPRSHVRDSLFRDFPSSTAVRARRSPSPSRRCEVSPTAGCPTAPAPPHSTTGLRSVPESVANRDCLGHDPPDSLLSFPPSGSSSSAARMRVTPPCPSTAFRGPRRVAGSRPDEVLRLRLPRPRFVACNPDTEVPTLRDPTPLLLLFFLFLLVRHFSF
jgi:hypothetical protein